VEGGEERSRGIQVSLDKAHGRDSWRKIYPQCIIKQSIAGISNIFQVDPHFGSNQATAREIATIICDFSDLILCYVLHPHPPSPRASMP
jgi:hypothetical protein